MSTSQLWLYYTDLQQSSYMTHLALVHGRFSTNTFPSWERAHPQRCGTVNIKALRYDVLYKGSHSFI